MKCRNSIAPVRKNPSVGLPSFRGSSRQEVAQEQELNNEKKAKLNWTNEDEIGRAHV